MCITLLKNTIRLFADEIEYRAKSNSDEMKTDDFIGEYIRIISELYEIIVNVEEKGLLPNRLSTGFEKELKRFISVVNDNNIGILALSNFNNDTYWAILAVNFLAKEYFELVNAEKGESCCDISNNLDSMEYISNNLYPIEFTIKHRTELDAIARRIYKRLHNPDALNNGKQPTTIPEELNTKQGLSVLRRAIEGKILDENYQLLKGITNGQAYAFVLCAKEELKLEHHWKTFETLWNKKNLCNNKLVNTSQKKIDAIKKLFPKHIAHNALYNKD